MRKSVKQLGRFSIATHDSDSARIPQFKLALQQARHKHGVAKTPNASVSKSFPTLAPNERQFRSDHQALMIDVHSEAETYWLCYRMLVPRALNHRQLRNPG